MAWTDQVFNYCERGLNPDFWAEPVNALSNTAFLVAAAVAGARLARLPPAGTDTGLWAQRLVLWLMALLVAVIGVGSFLFHTYATRWALVADVGPITAFMLVYLAFALRCFLGTGWLAIAAILPAFLALGSLSSNLACVVGPLATPGPDLSEPCLNGSLGYAPALLALAIVGTLAAARQQAAGWTLLAAAGVFLVSLMLRTVDRDLCAAPPVLGGLPGTHALWHLLNAVTLHLLLAAGIRHVGSAGPGHRPDGGKA